MKFFVYIFIISISLTSFAHMGEGEVKPDNCQSPENCISKLHKNIDRSRPPGQYPSKIEEAIIRRLLDFGDEAFPYIVKLLDNDDELIARNAAVALAEAEKIPEKYLPAIVKGIENNVSWLAPALAKVGTENAAEIAVKLFLDSYNVPHNRLALAVELFGKTAVPEIINAAMCKYGCNENTYYVLGYVLGRMESIGADVAPELMDLAEDPEISDQIKQGILSMIKYFGESGIVIEGRLLNLRKNQPQFIHVINNALIGIRSVHSGEIYADILSKNNHKSTLRDIAELGIIGNQAGKIIIDLLDGEQRLFAARTVGYIEYKQSVAKLILFLNEPSDVQLNWIAAESLGRIKGKSALPALKIASKKHWYPPVREAAAKAIDHILSGKSYESKYHKNNFSLEYFSFEHMGLDSCQYTELNEVAEPQDRKLYPRYAKDKLETLSYQSEIVGFGLSKADRALIGNTEHAIGVRPSKIRQEIRQIPNVALRVDGGWLAGSSRGEFGGELIFFADNGKARKIVEDNINDIFKLGNRYIAIAGLAHMMSDNGVIYELILDENNSWKSKSWLKLPSAPTLSKVVEDGKILIETYSGGNIILSSNGSMRMASCK